MYASLLNSCTKLLIRHQFVILRIILHGTTGGEETLIVVSTNAISTAVVRNQQNVILGRSYLLAVLDEVCQ